jgi:hypothetical protein
MLRVTERLSDAALPAVARDGGSHFARNNHAEPHLTSVILAAIDYERAV